jgi:hypothetical protein
MQASQVFKIFKWSTGAILCGAAIYILSQYLAVEKINRVIRETIRGVESSDQILTLAYISDSYHDGYGYSKSDLGDIARRAFSEFEDIRVHIISRKIERSHDSATVVLEIKVVAAYGPQRGYIIGSPQESRRVVLDFAFESDGWRIIKAEGLN